MSEKKNLSRKVIRLLRKIQKFLIEEPRRFDMADGITDADGLVGKTYNNRMDRLYEAPPCGTACCIAGAGYVIHTGILLNHSNVPWPKIFELFTQEYHMDTETCDRLFYTKMQFSINDSRCWPNFYSEMYKNAKTPLERACVGVARIEHFIATDGRE